MKGDIFKIGVVVISAGVLITAICWPTGSLGGRAKAPEFREIANWINSRPLTMAE